jgi:hypothetical protein
MIALGPTTRNRGASFPASRPSSQPHRTTVLARQGPLRRAKHRRALARSARLCLSPKHATPVSAGNEAKNKSWPKQPGRVGVDSTS